MKKKLKKSKKVVKKSKDFESEYTKDIDNFDKEIKEIHENRLI